ncbi:hypothetical protein LVQ78_22390 [Buttiauxella sp. A2-C2_NF]|uniref:hypothetical protein n=1 Tax=Buttiauxella ferragutiae TaxID=82989 RepID=UPI001E361AC3|nr:hypothetical protein [Buttiauxella ferragutiae]MCE0828758.1 hypothetical protein [Buttiauxella ferragutiae]UNK63180.1 hypothetical protein MNO13_09815 [Buttiauxella ferragutiae]
MSMPGVAWFKETSLETGQWIWGTLQGSFNEKQTISQIIVDAVIGMIPLVGDVTAVRDLIAVSMGLAKDPRKRESVSEWVFLVILLFALIPVIGGVIKGVGRLALRVTKEAAENVETLSDIIKFLNRVGEGDAVKWLNKLNVVQYQAQLIEKMSDFCHTMITAINQILKARIGQMLPEKWQADLIRVRDGFAALQPLAAKMIPQALKELDAKLRVLQAMVYKGEIHTVATGAGRAEVRREAEAYLLEKEVHVAAKQGSRFPSNSAEVKDFEKLSEQYSMVGYPDLLAYEGGSPAFGKKKIFPAVASFSGKVTAMNAQDLAGSTLYRVFGHATKDAQESYAGGRATAFWGFEKVPTSAENWRLPAAVLDEWNGNGFIVVMKLPDNFASIMPHVTAWHGNIAEQFGKELPNQYLDGGGKQVIINLGDLAQKISDIGKEVKQSNKAFSTEINGIHIEFKPTGWQEVNGKYGFDNPDNIKPPFAETRQLSDTELQSKTGTRAVVSGVRAEHQTSKAEQE